MTEKVLCDHKDTCKTYRNHGYCAGAKPHTPTKVCNKCPVDKKARCVKAPLTPAEEKRKKAEADIMDACHVLDNTPLNGVERKAWATVRTFVTRQLDALKENNEH